MTTSQQTNSNRPFTVRDAVLFEEIGRAAQRRSTVRRFYEGRIVVGQALCLGDQRGNAQPRADVRDLYLCVSFINDVDQYWPVEELMAQFEVGEFIAGPR